MPKFLPGLFESKAAPKNAIPRAVSNSRTSLASAVPNMQIWDIDQAINQGYERVIWVYRCIDAIASNSSRVPMILREYDDVDGKQVEDEQLMRLLNRRPNIYETSQQFRYRVASQLLLSRRGVFIEVIRDRMGRPTELHILPPGMTRPIPDPEKYVSGYIVQTQRQGTVELEPDQVIWMRAKPHPTDVYAQMTPLVAAGLAIDTDWLARLYNRNFLANDGRPGMLVGVSGQLGIEDAEEIRRRFSGGPNAAGQTTVIEADGITAVDMASNPRDVQYLEAVRGSKEDILLAFGTPESQLGNASGRTFDNADAEAEMWWNQTLVPFMDAMAAGYDVLTAEGLKDDIFVAHDYSAVDVLQRQERSRHEKAMAEFQAGTLTIDEYLERVGRDTFNVPGTQVLWIPQGNVPVGKDEQTTQAAASLMPVGMGQPANPQEEARKGALQGVQQGQREFGNELSARILRLAGKKNDPFDPTDPEYPTDQPPLEPEIKITPGSVRAKPHERITGSDKNREGSASKPAGSGTVELTAAIERSLADKVKAHNEAAKEPWSKTTIGQLRSVYRRGAGAFSSSHRPGKTRNQWAMARVNAYLHLLNTGKPKNPKYTTDNDLLPKGHPAKGESKVLDFESVIEFKEEPHPYESARNAVEAEISGLLSAWSRRQERNIVERIGGAKARKNTRHWDGEPGTKALDAVYIVNPDQWADDLVDSLGDLMQAIAEKEALKAARELDKAGVVERLIDDGSIDGRGRTALDRLIGQTGMNRRAVMDRIAATVNDMIRQSALRQSEKVVERITELDSQGASIDDIKREVQKMIGSRSSWKRGLATAAATSVMEGARNEVYAKGGKYVKRVWKTMRDERVRPSHRKAYGQKRSADRPFRVGGSALMYPGDLTAPIEETANCRCWVELEIVGIR